jgi:predicted enzyme related to lactoylglutathione lyase
MQMNEYEPGVPSWVDLATPDLDRAKDFYRALFGWEILDGPPEAGGYSMAMRAGFTIAGLGPQMNPSAPPAWSNYINVASADDTAERVTANGGTVLMPPFDVLDVGRMTMFADPAGAMLGVWEPRAHRGAQLVNEAGTWSWSELLTTDTAGAIDFYGSVFGWGAMTHGEGPGAYTEFTVNDRSIAGMMLKPPMMPAEVPPFWGVYFTVDDADAAAARVVELGGQQLTPAMDIEPGRFVTVADPTGAAFYVIRFTEQPH